MGGGGAPDPARIFVSGLTEVLTDEDLRAHFEALGAIKDLFVPTFYHSRERRNFFFVTFEEVQSAQSAVSQGTHVVKGVSLSAIAATDRPAADKGKGPTGGDPATAGGRVYLSGLGEDLSDEDLRGHFEQYGAIKDLFVPMFHDSNKRRNFGFITFEDPSSAKGAVSGSPHSLKTSNVNAVHATDRPADGKGKGKGKAQAGWGMQQGWGMQGMYGGMGMQGMWPQQQYGMQGGYGQQQYGMQGGYGQQQQWSGGYGAAPGGSGGVPGSTPY